MTNMLQKIFGQIETKEQFDALRITIESKPRNSLTRCASPLRHPKKFCPGPMAR